MRFSLVLDFITAVKQWIRIIDHKIECILFGDIATADISAVSLIKLLKSLG